MIRQSITDMFVRFSAPLEGSLHNAYLDELGLLTVGIGCLINTPALWSPLPWVMPDGSPASAAEVTRQLTSLIAQQALKNYSASSAVVQRATTIRLTDAGILQLVAARLAQDEPFMRKYFPEWDAWPADAQLAAFSMSWACGPGWPAEFGNCARLLNHEPPDFMLAIEHAPIAGHPGQFAQAAIDMNATHNPGLVPRNAQNELALSNAQVVIDRGLPRDVLYWPSTPLLVSDPPTGAT